MFSLVTRSSRVGAGRRGRASHGALGAPREPQGDIRAKASKELGMLLALIREASSRIQWHFLSQLKRRTVRVGETSSCFAPQPQFWEISSNVPGLSPNGNLFRATVHQVTNVRGSRRSFPEQRMELKVFQLHNSLPSISNATGTLI